MKTKNAREFSKEFKLEVLREVYSSKDSRYSIEKKYNLPSGITNAWEKKFPIEKFSVTLPPETIEAYKMAHEKTELTNEEILQKRIDDLERSLEYEKMRTRAFEKMIEIAEKEEGISILKKGGARQ